MNTNFGDQVWSPIDMKICAVTLKTDGTTHVESQHELKMISRHLNLVLRGKIDGSFDPQDDMEN